MVTASAYLAIRMARNGSAIRRPTPVAPTASRASLAGSGATGGSAIDEGKWRMGAVTGLSLMMLLLASPSAGAAASTARATEAPAKPQPAVEKLSCGELLAESARLDAEMAQLSDKLAQVDVPVSARTHALTGAGTALAAVAGNLPLPLAANALSAVGAKAVVKSHSDDVARAAAPILGQQDVAQARFDHVTTLYQNKCLNLK